MLKKVLEFIEKNRMLERGDRIVLGVSGGADSVCLLHIMNELKEKLDLELFVVHVNHHIRGGEAQRDADYVRVLCKKLGVKFVQADVDIPKLAAESGMSEEEAGRLERYRIFEEKAMETKADKIAVAHNLNDNSETVLFNLFRGTGIRGLTGIPVKRGKIIRPLLCCGRKEIENYLNENGIEYCTDSTNKLPEYSRNKIRLELLPYIEKNINSAAERNIVNAAENLRDINEYIESATDEAYGMYVKSGVFKKEGFKLHRAIKTGIIRKMIRSMAGKLKDVTKTHVDSVLELEQMSVSKRIDLPYDLTAERVYGGIRIAVAKKDESPKKKEKILYNGETFFTDGEIRVDMGINDINLQNIPELRYTKFMDCDKIQALTLRTRREGDYIVVDDKGSRQKLKNYFINEKIPKERRDDILLIADGSHVVWVVGYRMSADCRISEKTKNIIRITYAGDANDKE